MKWCDSGEPLNAPRAPWSGGPRCESAVRKTAEATAHPSKKEKKNYEVVR